MVIAASFLIASFHSSNNDDKSRPNSAPDRADGDDGTMRHVEDVRDDPSYEQFYALHSAEMKLPPPREGHVCIMIHNLHTFASLVFRTLTVISNGGSSGTPSPALQPVESGSMMRGDQMLDHRHHREIQPSDLETRPVCRQ